MFRMCDLKYFATHLVMFFEYWVCGKILVEPKELSLRIVPLFSIAGRAGDYVVYVYDTIWFSNVRVRVPIAISFLRVID